MKDRRHYGEMLEEVVMDVTPEQAGVWLTTRPPLPALWSRGAANNEKAARYAAIMAAGEWETDRPVEPVMISMPNGHILGGHHRLTAVTMIGKPQSLKVRFYSKPKGWDQALREIKEREAEEARLLANTPTCSLCGWHGADTQDGINAHELSAHGDDA